MEQRQGHWVHKESNCWETKEDGPNNPPHLFRTKIAGFSTTTWSVPLRELPNAYFELSTPGVHREHATFGVCPEGVDVSGFEVGWVTQPTKSKDVLGWGITADSRLFSTVNGKITYLDYLPNEAAVYPCVGADIDEMGFSHHLLNIDVKNPCPEGPYVPTSTSNKKYLELLGNPIGQMDYSSLPKTYDAFCRLPLDILKSIKEFIGPTCVDLVVVCKSLHRTLVPTFKWIDPHAIHKSVVGRYTHLKHKNTVGAGPCYTLAYELKADGTLVGTKRWMPPHSYDSEAAVKTPMTGVWTVGYTQVLVEVPPRPEQGPFRSMARGRGPATGASKPQPGLGPSKTKKVVVRLFSQGGVSQILVEGLKKVDVTDDVWERNYLDDPQRKISAAAAFGGMVSNSILAPKRNYEIRKCGVPLEQQIADEDCCHEVIQELMESVWTQDYEPLGCQVKQDIIARVSLKCMAPPGLTDHEIRFALAQEIANCQQWIDAFQVVNI